METQTRQKVISVSGMTCSACENKLERAVSRFSGVSKVTANRHTAELQIHYSAEKVDWEALEATLEALGYPVVPGPVNEKSTKAGTVRRWLPILLMVLVVLWLLDRLSLVSTMPELTTGVSYGLIFVIGLMTSVHCVAMCGGINLTQCLPSVADVPVSPQASRKAALKSSILYNSGRVLSYTVLGGLIGAAGQALSFDEGLRGGITLAAGLWMVLMGLNLSGAVSWTRKLMPRLPAFHGKGTQGGKSARRPLVVGLLNGFMPCGPLQTMQIYALGTGSFTAGALSMLAFSLGTVPLMFGLGFFSGVFGRRSSQRWLSFSAALVIALGVVMMGRGMSLAGISLKPGISALELQNLEDYGSVAVVGNGVQYVEIQLSPGYYEPIVVQRGIPVKFNIKAEPKALNGCNDAIQIPAYQIQMPLKPGDNWIEFFPEKAGVVPFSCWMGMIRSEILVVDALDPKAKP